MRRRSLITPTYDFGPLTITALGSWYCDGSHRWPKLDIILRDRWTKPSCTGTGRATIYRRLSLPLPWIHWRWQYQWPVLRPAHRLLSWLYRSWVKGIRQRGGSSDG